MYSQIDFLYLDFHRSLTDRQLEIGRFCMSKPERQEVIRPVDRPQPSNSFRQLELLLARGFSVLLPRKKSFMHRRSVNSSNVQRLEYLFNSDVLASLLIL